MIIAISGLTGSGKTTIGDMVAKKLKIKHVSMTHKKFIPAGRELLDLCIGFGKLTPIEQYLQPPVSWP